MGLGARRWLQRHIRLLFRPHLAGGIGLLSVLAGWSFEVNVRNVAAIAVLLFAQLLSVSVAAWVFRRRTDGPLISFWMYGNPTFWTAPVAAAALGAEAAVFVIAYDMLTQARIALGVRYLRRQAPKSQSRGTALADYAPTYGALAGLLVGLVLPAPDIVDTFVAGLGIVMAGVGALLSASPGRIAGSGRRRSRSPCKGSRCTGRSSPAVLAVATLAGVDLPGAVWILALGPIPLRSSRSPGSTAIRRGPPRPGWRSASPARSRCCQFRSRLHPECG